MRLSKKISLFYLLILISTMLNAQQFQRVFRSLETPSNLLGSSGIELQNGGFIISYSVQLEAQQDQYNIGLMRLSAQGDTVWTRSYGNDNSHESFGIIETFDNK